LTKELQFFKAKRERLRGELTALAARREKLSEAGIALAAAEKARDEFEASESTSVTAWASSGCSGPRLNYDGSLRSLFALYQTRPASPYHRLKATSRTQYDDYLASFARAHGNRRVDMLIAFDIINWHDVKSAPYGIDPPRFAAARAAFFALKSALSFGHACGFEDCRVLLDELVASGFRVPSK
jgi:hypothetical protein